MLLSQTCFRIHVNTRFANMPFVWCERGLLYCRCLRDAIDANGKVAEKGPKLQCRFFDKPHFNMYLMRGRTHRARSMEFVTRHWTAMRKPVFVKWHSLEVPAVPTMDRHQYYVSVPVF